MYASAFESVDRLSKLDDFASRFGADFYRLPYNDGEVVLHKSTWKPALELQLGSDQIRPYGAGKDLHWKMT